MKWLILILASCATVAPPKDSDPQWVVSGLTGHKQETNTWCALASAQMLLEKHGVKTKQCEIASKLTGLSCCDKSLIACEKKTSTVEEIAALYGLKTSLLKVDINVVVEKIKQGIPVAIYHIQRTTEFPHSVVAYGAYESDGKPHVVVYDPLTGANRHFDERYVTGNFAWYRIVEVLK